MIESIEFKNFKALRDTTLPLGRFTLIVGPNGSGKSTALKSLQIASNPSKFKYHQVVSVNPISDNNKTTSFVFHFNDGGLFKKEISWNENATNYRPNTERESKLLHVQIYTLEEKAISVPATLSQYINLQQNGEGLAGVLDQMRDKNPERFEDLNKELELWLPEFDRVLFETTQDGRRAFLLRMKEGRHSIAATDLSQGVLLALAMLTLAYLPDPPSIVCLEEPDRGIHPRLLRDIQDALYRLAYPENYGEKREPVQVIATTHSPYFLDLFRDHPEEVVLANKTEDGTKFERLSDQPNLDEILEDSHLGEVWYTGILGGVPAHA